MNSAVALYQNLDLTAQVETSSPSELIQLLFDGANTRLRRALNSIHHGDIDGRTNSLNSAVAIFEGLQASLDHDKGGDLAGNLDSLYEYMQRRCYEANLSNDDAAVVEVIELLASINSAWSVLAEKESGQD